MFRLFVVPSTIFNVRVLVVRIALALALAFTMLSSIATADSAFGATCKNIFVSADGGSDDMPVDAGKVAMVAKGCKDAPAQPPVVKGPSPVVKPRPVEPPKPTAKPKPKPQPAAKPKPKPKPKPQPQPAARPQPAVRPAPPAPHNPPAVKQTTRKPAPAVKSTVKAAEPKKAKPAVKETPLPACAAMVPIVTTDFQFPWLLVGFGMLLSLIAGGVACTRTFMATGHKWPGRLRRFIAGPDHRRIDS